MATFYKRSGKRGIRWTVRVRIAGREVTRTWATKEAAKAWARAQETAIDKGEYFAPRPGTGALLADVIDEFVTYRAIHGRAPGKTFSNALKRLKVQHGLEPLGNLTVDFWRRHALKRIAKGRSGSTVASELAYAGSVLRHAAREGHSVDASAPGAARTKLREGGVDVKSRERTRRLTDDELDRLFAWIDANAERTFLPLRDLVEFALATAMRRGEILALERTNIKGRVANIKRKHPRDPNRREDVPLLKPHKAWPRVDPLEIIERQPKAGRRVFPYVGDTVGFWFEAALKGAAIDGAVFHLLRHECLSRLADRGFDPLRLAMIGGHRDLKSVKRYAKLDPEKLANE